MSTQSPNFRCPRCGSELPRNAPQGLCPACLMRAALGTGTQSASAAPSNVETAAVSDPMFPSPEELTALFPQLDVQELVGWGGMGVVYRARQTHLDRPVALKIIRPEVSLEPTFAERFNREARLLARLNHPHIVTIYDFGKIEVDGSDPGVARTLYYFLMEYVDGTNLRHVIRSQQLAPAQALAIVPQICDALQYAHDEGVVHRDIKPENILIDRRGRVKIADFGLAKLAARSDDSWTLTSTHNVMGTPRYMAPEQMDGFHEVDHRADIYSLGVVFYELLTGQLPLGHFEPPSQRVEVDVRLDQVVLRTLARDPDRRYQHASHVKSDVEAVREAVREAVHETIAGGSVGSPHVPPAKQVTRKQVTHTSADKNNGHGSSGPDGAAEIHDAEERQRAAELAEIAPDSESYRIIGLLLGGWLLTDVFAMFRQPGLWLAIALLVVLIHYSLQRRLKYLPKLRDELSRQSRWQRVTSRCMGGGILAIAILCWIAAVVAGADLLTTSMLPNMSRYSGNMTNNERMSLANSAGITELAEPQLSTVTTGSFRVLLGLTPLTYAYFALSGAVAAVGTWIDTRRYRYSWKHWWRPSLSLTFYLFLTAMIVHLGIRFNLISRTSSTEPRTERYAADWVMIEQRLNRWLSGSRLLGLR